MNAAPLASLFDHEPEMQELLTEFRAGLEESAEQLAKLLEQQDLEGLRRLGHQMKGAGGGYGFPEITDAGAKLEDAVKNDQAVSENVRSAAAELADLFHRARAIDA